MINIREGVSVTAVIHIDTIVVIVISIDVVVDVEDKGDDGGNKAHVA